MLGITKKHHKVFEGQRVKRMLSRVKGRKASGAVIKTVPFSTTDSGSWVITLDRQDFPAGRDKVDAEA